MFFWLIFTELQDAAVSLADDIGALASVDLHFIDAPGLEAVVPDHQYLLALSEDARENGSKRHVVVVTSRFSIEALAAAAVGTPFGVHVVPAGEDSPLVNTALANAVPSGASSDELVTRLN